MSDRDNNKPLAPSETEKQTQKAILKRHVDPAGPMLKYIQNRCSMALRRTSPWLQPTMAGALQLLPPEAYPDVPTSSLTTRFVASTQNKTRCPVFCTRFAPDSRRVLTGDSAGGISVWSTQDFGYMQYLQVHNKAIRDICFTHNGKVVLAADDTGAVKISSINLKPLREIAAHELPVRAVCASPSDQAIATCSDDNTVKVFDLSQGTTATFAGRSGHGGEVRCVDWHPCTSLLASCGRDAMVKLWDARMKPESAMLATLSGHKQAVNKVSWNLNGTWVASCSRDFTVKVWDVRHSKREMVSWQGHQGGKDITAVAWHPIHLDLLASTGADGSFIFWLVGQPEPLVKVEAAHENMINALAFHPMGHEMTTCAVDGVSKFWVRPRPGDPWKDSTQQEQEEYTALLAKTLPGGQAAQLPGLSGPSSLGGGMPSKLPGGINLQVPRGQGGYDAGQASPDGRGIPGLPRPPPMPLPPGAPMAPGLQGAPPPGGPAAAAAGRGMQRGMHAAAAAAGAAAGAGGMGGVPGLMGAGRGGLAMHGGVKRQREGQEGPGYDGAGGGGQQQQQFRAPHKQQQQFHAQMQQHHHMRPMQQQQPPGHNPHDPHYQQQQRPPFGVRGPAGQPPPGGRGYPGVPPPGGGRGYGRGFGRGRH